MKTKQFIVVIFILIALLGATRAGAVVYKTMDNQVQTTSTFPSFNFRSTSAYSKQCAGETLSILLNHDGSLNYDAYLPSGPNHAKNDVTPPILPPNPNPDSNDEGNVPFGEGIIELIAMAWAYLGSRKYVTKNNIDI